MDSDALCVRRLLHLIETRSAGPLSVRRLAAEIGRSEAYGGTLFRQTIGTSVHEYIARVRIDRAVTSIREGVKVEAVALEVGYRSKKNFYRQFRRRFGMTPGAYRRSFAITHPV